MAVITPPQSQSQSQNNSLGLLGTLGIFGGTLLGVPALSTLGTGMVAANKLLNGQGNMNDYKENASAFQDAIKGLWGWVNPASGNIAKSPGDQSHILKYMRDNFSL